MSHAARVRNPTSTPGGLYRLVTPWGELVLPPDWSLRVSSSWAQPTTQRARRDGATPVGVRTQRPKNLSLAGLIPTTARPQRVVVDAQAYADSPKDSTALAAIQRALAAPGGVLRVGERQVAFGVVSVDEPQAAIGGVALTARLEALDPWWENINETTLTVTDQDVVSVRGLIPARPVVTIAGPVSSGTEVVNARTGASLKLNQPVAAGEVAVLDTLNVTATNGGVNALGSVSAGIALGWELLPGRNKINLTVATEVVFSWRERWLTWRD